MNTKKNHLRSQKKIIYKNPPIRQKKSAKLQFQSHNLQHQRSSRKVSIFNWYFPTTFPAFIFNFRLVRHARAHRQSRSTFASSRHRPVNKVFWTFVQVSLKGRTCITFAFVEDVATSIAVREMSLIGTQRLCRYLNLKKKYNKKH